MSMITVSEAHEQLRSKNRVRVDDESVDLKDCLGRVLAADVFPQSMFHLQITARWMVMPCGVMIGWGRITLCRSVNE